MNRSLSVQRSLRIPFIAALCLILSACASLSGPRSPQAVAQSAITRGNVNVHMDDGVAVVTGWVSDYTSRQAVTRALLEHDDVESVKMMIFRQM